MSHFTVIVSERNMSAEEALAPFNENTEVEPYETECYCISIRAGDAATEVMAASYGPGYIGKCRDQVHAAGLNEEDSDKLWRELTGPFFARQDALKREFRKLGPNPDCEKCRGTGTVLSTYNPQSKWDWYSLGGRWLGYFKLKGRKGGKLGRAGVFGNEAAPSTCDQARFGDIETPDRPFAFIDHDGAWHERAKMGWWACTSNERDDEYEAEWQAFLASCTPDDVLAMYDCHI